MLLFLKKAPAAARIINRILLAFSVFGIVFATVANRSSGDFEPNFIPFSTLLASREQYDFFRSLVMNVLLFLPVGLTLPFSLPDGKKNFGKTVLIAAAFSVLAELLQLVFKLGRCETDDVICNTLGAFIGALSYLIANWKNIWSTRKSKI